MMSGECYPRNHAGNCTRAGMAAGRDELLLKGLEVVKTR